MIVLIIKYEVDKFWEVGFGKFFFWKIFVDRFMGFR